MAAGPRDRHAERRQYAGLGRHRRRRSGLAGQGPEEGLGQLGQTVTSYGAQLLTLQFSRSDESDADLVGITGCFCAVAETGTLMMCSSPATPAAVSLLPETHIAIVLASRILPYMEDAWDLARKELGTLPRAVNFISGPSRTGDIEQTIVLGAHGPYRVHLVIVGG